MFEDAGGRHPPRWVDWICAAGSEYRLIRHPGDVVGAEREVRHGADLVVVQPIGHHHGQGGKDASFISR